MEKDRELKPKVEAERVTKRTDEKAHVKGYEREGVEVVYFGSCNQLEEDLAGANSTEVYSEKDKRRAFNKTCEGIMNLFGKYIEVSRLDRLFPGINPEELSDYDFSSNSRIKVYILDFENMSEITNLLEREIPDKFEIQGYNLNFNLGRKEDVPRFQDSPKLPRVVGRLFPEKAYVAFDSEIEKLILIKEPSGIIAKNPEIKELYLRDKLFHEIFHSLGIAEKYPTSTEEGIVEAFSTMTGSSESDVLYHRNNVQYPEETAAAMTFILFASSQGVSNESIVEGLFGYNEEKRKDLAKFAARHLGLVMSLKFFYTGMSKQEFEEMSTKIENISSMGEMLKKAQEKVGLKQ